MIVRSKIMISSDSGTCSPYKSNWIYVIGILLLLMGFLSLSLYTYYKSLVSIKQSEDKGR